VRSATFFTAQVDFAQAGDLSLFVDDQQLDMLAEMAGGQGYVDGRYLAATFNLLRGRDLIWNTVVQNYLLGEEQPAFDLLHWNGDTTNLPAAWHLDYLRDFYRDNLLVRPGGLSVAGTPIDLSKVATPAYVQAGREDHIAPAESVWKITEHFVGPLRFVLAGSGHIAGVVNPPDAEKYQYWTSEEPAATLAAFTAQARETKGSWWPDWRAWLATHDGCTVPVRGARIPGKGKRSAIEDAPGRYVRLR
jgi:polyhydroxyalkanoate synthase